MCRAQALKRTEQNIEWRSFKSKAPFELKEITLADYRFTKNFQKFATYE